MIKHRIEDGILIIHMFSCKKRLEPICRKVRELMSDPNFTSGMVIVNFHSQVDWDDYYDFVAESDRAISRIHSIGIIVQNRDQLEKMKWRAGMLQVLGIDTQMFESVSQLGSWAESKLPQEIFEELV